MNHKLFRCVKLETSREFNCYIHHSLSVYQVEVVTGNKRGAGTDAHVFLTIYGDRETTRRVQLVNRYVSPFD